MQFWHSTQSVFVDIHLHFHLKGEAIESSSGNLIQELQDFNLVCKNFSFWRSKLDHSRLFKEWSGHPALKGEAWLDAWETMLQ